MATALARPASSSLARSPSGPPNLPVWPIYALFLGYPLWWLLGAGSFAVVLLAVPMTMALVLRGRVSLPRHFGVWLLFLLFILSSAIQVDSALRLVGVTLRASNYLGATVVFLYLYNIPPERLPKLRVVYLLTGFWAFVVFGGYLGLLFPGGSVPTLMSKVVPAAIAANDYVQTLVNPPLAEVQDPYGAPAPYVRPSAPFSYTNGWGCAYALLVPAVLLALQSTSRWWRFLLTVLLAASLVPAFATLNRGMFLALALTLSYAAVRLAWRGHVGPLAALAVFVTAALLLASSAGVWPRITERTTYSSTNVTRELLYRETVARTLQSPLFGYGAPRPSETLDISVGTQGHVWNVMFSYGFPALACFLGWLWWMTWRSRRSRDRSSFWLHVLLFDAAVTVLYYGYDGMLLTIVLTAAALLSREPWTYAPGSTTAARFAGRDPIPPGAPPPIATRAEASAPGPVDFRQGGPRRPLMQPRWVREAE